MPVPVAPPSEPYAVETIVVRAARLAPGRGEAVFSTVRIDPKTLEEGPRLDDALRSVPGVSLFRRSSSLSANPTTQGLSLRAIAPSGAGRALVTLDGVPQNDPFGGWVIWSALPSESIESARVVRGAGAGPYGAGALTGVVELQERVGHPDEAVLDLRGGELGSARGAAVADIGVGPGDLLLSASGERSDGWTPVRAGHGYADTPLSLRTASVSGRYSFDLGDGVLAARVSAYDEDRGTGLRGGAAAANGGSASLTWAQQPEIGRLGFRVQAWARQSDFSQSSVSVAAGRGSTTPANDQLATPANSYGVNAAVRREGERGSLEVGVDARAAEGETQERFRYMAGAFTRDRVAGGETAVAGAYVEGSWRDGPWLWAGGARVDGWRSTGAIRRERDRATGVVTFEEHPEDQSGVSPTARFGVRRALSDDLYVRTAAYAGFRPPTLNELHRPFRVGNDVTESNPGLEPERLFGVEAGLGGRWWSATAFYNRLEDAITNVTIGVGPGTFPRAGFIPAGGVLRQRANAGTIDAVGLEAEGEQRIGQHLALTGAVSITDARVDGGSNAPQLTGKRPAQAPIWTAVAGLRWQATSRLDVDADARFESRRFEDDLNSRELSPSVSVDLKATWRIRDGAEVYLAAANLLDAEVETGETADGTESFGAPRVVMAGVRLKR
jgi:outer membrane receptor protein involved in Fe transport